MTSGLANVTSGRRLMMVEIVDEEGSFLLLIE
jgi:hypothetical protein